MGITATISAVTAYLCRSAVPPYFVVPLIAVDLYNLSSAYPSRRDGIPILRSLHSIAHDRDAHLALLKLPRVLALWRRRPPSSEHVVAVASNFDSFPFWNIPRLSDWQLGPPDAEVLSRCGCHCSRIGVLHPLVLDPAMVRGHIRGAEDLDLELGLDVAALAPLDAARSRI